MNPRLPPVSRSTRPAPAAAPRDSAGPVPAAAPATALTTFADPNRRYREREVGVGYGQSSGYASERRHAASALQPRFRFA